MKFRRVSATSYCNYFLLYILLLNASCSTTWDLVEYKLPFSFPVTILCCILTIRYYISYVFHEVLLTKLSIVEYNYGYCKTYCLLYQLLLRPKYFLQDILNKIECSWVLAVYTVTTWFFVKVFSNRTIQLLLTNSRILEYHLLLLYKVFLTF